MKLLYGTETAITLTLTALASGGGRQGTAVVNTTNDYLDALVVPSSIKTAGGSLSTTGPVVSIYAYGSLDGTTWADGLTGTDAAWTPPANITGRLIAQIPIDTAAVAKTYNACSVANAFGGVLPPYWALAAVNSTGLALDATAGGALNFTGVSTQ